MFANFYKTTGTCTADCHVWFTASTPPDESLKCECGKTTYGRERDNARKENKMTKAYNEGHTAFYNRVKRHDNPYAGRPDKCEEYANWDRGWSDAYRMQAERLEKAGAK